MFQLEIGVVDSEELIVDRYSVTWMDLMLEIYIIKKSDRWIGGYIDI